MSLQIYLLGPMRALADGAGLKLPPRSRVVSLWAYLLMHAERPLPRATVAFTFWPDASEPQARANLRRHLHHLLDLLPLAPDDRPWLLSDRSTVGWNPSSDSWLDVVEFQRWSAEPARLEDAVSLYGGDLLEGIYDDWVFGPRERLRALYASDLAAIVEDHRARGAYRQAILRAEELLRHDPLREGTYRLLMSLHGESGDRAGVVRTFNACVSVLRRELEIEPSAETQQAFEASMNLETTPSLPAEPATARHDNLPLQLSSFVGRARELQEARGVMESSRLATLTGISGVGKTRLALALAEEVKGSFPEGAWWIDLGPLTDASLVPQAFAAALELHDRSETPLPRALADALGSKRLLLVVDNCEHVIDQVASLVDLLLREAPGIRILATSTTPLRVPGEATWQVPTMPVAEEAGIAGAERLPAPGDRLPESMALFVERATSSLPTFRLTPQNVETVARICRELDGIPLAIELAAARMRALSVDQLLERLDNRFRLLTHGDRTGVPRHQTLRATLDWSYALLTPAEQALLRRLSLFVGGFTLASAESVFAQPPVEVDQVLELVSELVDKSLIQVSRTDPARVRYRLLETVNEYAREKLLEAGEEELVRASFVSYCLRVVGEAGPHLLRGPDQERWFDLLRLEYDNLRSALSWAAAAGEVETLARMSGHLWPFWWTHGYVNEGLRWLEAALPESETVSSELHATLLHAAGRLMILQGAYERARPILEENLALSRSLDDAPVLAEALSSAGLVASHLGDYRQADALWEEAQSVYEAAGDRWGVARSLNNRGDLAVYTENYPEAIERLERSLALFQELQSTFGESVSLINLGRACSLTGETQRAAGYFLSSLALKVTMADKEGIAWNLEGLAGVAGLEGDATRAARLFGAAEALREAIGIPVAPPDLPFYRQNLDRARRLLDPPAWERHWEEGRSLSLEQALVYAQEGMPEHGATG